MTGWLLDTNVISELSKPRPQKAATSFLQSRPPDQLFVSSITFAELRFGLQLVNDVLKRSCLDEWLGQVRSAFATRTLGISKETMFIWRVLLAEGRKANRTFSQPDLLLAATSIEHGLVLATRNVNDFRYLPVKIINPWVR